MHPLTKTINRALATIQQENHSVEKGIRDALMDCVGPLFDKPHNTFPLRPSGCLKPMRDLYYELVNYYTPGTIPKADFEPRVKLIFEFGHMTETLLKNLTKEYFEVVFEQEKVKYGQLMDKNGNVVELSGAIDWAIKLDSGSDALTLCDSKSIADFPYKKAPKEEHIAQMQLYMHSEWGRTNKVNNALLIYFNKNTCDIKVIEIPYDAELAANILKRFELVYDYYKKGIVPPREYFAGLDWQANYSSYRDYDNIEFTLDSSQRELIAVEEYAPNSEYEKDDIRNHVEKYGNKAVNYIDKIHIIGYDGKKLTLNQL